MTTEGYAASRTRDGSTSNEDASWVFRPTGHVAALCDGAGNAQRCASRVLTLFRRQIETGTLKVERFPAWRSWLTSVDASLAGASQTTFVGVAAVDGRLVGAYAGDSKAFLVNEHGCRELTESRTPRLGSGEAEPAPIHERLQPRDVILLMSDGAWMPISPSAIHREVMSKALQHLADVPVALLDLAGKHGRIDDMTVVALRVR